MPDNAGPRHAHALVACARQEDARIQEWVEYHRSIGFDHVYLYCNDDEPCALLKAAGSYLLGPDPFITFRHWPAAGQRAEMFLHFLATFKDEADWFAFLDIDEFLVLKDGGDVAGFMLPFHASADCVYFNGFNYGSNGKVHRDDSPVLLSHLRRAAEPDPRTRMICRSSAVDASAVAAGHGQGGGDFWSALDGYGIAGLRCVNVLGQPMDGYSADFPQGAAAMLARPEAPGALLAKGYVAHYRFQSEDDFLRRHARGGLPDGERWKAAFEAGEHKAILERDNAVYDTYLAAYWHRYTNAAQDLMIRIPEENLPAPNIALNKPSWQSSIYEPGDSEPPGSRVSGGGNNGVRTGAYGFHTQLEDSPWWVVDLLGSYGVLAVRVFNRLDSPPIAARANELDVLVSMDASSWTVIHSRTEPEPFGGLHGEPLSVHPAEPAQARFVAVRLRQQGFLHLDEVEVYGLPL